MRTSQTLASSFLFFVLQWFCIFTFSNGSIGAYSLIKLIPTLFPPHTAATSATRASEATATAGSATGSAASDQDVWLGQHGQAAGCHQVPAGDSEGGGPADETAERATTTATTSDHHSAEPDSKQNCTWHLFSQKAFVYFLCQKVKT